MSTRDQRPEDRASQRQQREQRQVKKRPLSPEKVAPKVENKQESGGFPSLKGSSKAFIDKEAREQAVEQLSRSILQKKGLLNRDGQVKKEQASPLVQDSAKPAKRPSLYKRAKNAINTKRVGFKGDWEQEGFEHALNNQFKGLGTVLKVGLGYFLTPAGSLKFFKFMDTLGVQYFGGIIALLCALIVVGFASTLFVVMSFITFVVLLFAAVMIILFVPDNDVDVSGIDMSGLDGSGIEAVANSSGVEDTASSAKEGSMSTPSELRGKFVAMYADQTPHLGKFKDWRTSRYHWGVDYDWTKDVKNTPIYPAAEGVVYAVSNYAGGCKAGTTGSYGHFITIVHPDIIGPNGKPFVTRYAHMLKASPLKAGDKVYLNTIIGYIGSTGCSTGPHIHFELIPAEPARARQTDGVDPDKYLTCSADGKTVADFRTPLKGSHYHFPECFEYQKQVRGVK